MDKVVINDDMTLEEKLQAIDEAMKKYQIEFNKNNSRPLDAPIDPSLAVMCFGCQ